MIAHYSIPGDGVWHDVNTLASLALGTACRLINIGVGDLYVETGQTVPASNAFGLPLTNIYQPYAVMEVPFGADTIWVRAEDKDGGILAVQEV